MGSHCPFGHLKHKSYGQKKGQNQTANLTLDHEKSGIDPISLHANNM